MTALLPLLVSAALAAAPDHQDEVVNLKVTWTRWETGQPWNKSNPEIRNAHAVVVDGVGTKGRALLTTAQMVEYAVHLRVSKLGDPAETAASVLYVDRETNLALVSVSDPAFFSGLEPARLARSPVVAGEVNIARWRDNQFETSKGRIIRATATVSTTGTLSYPSLRVQTDMSGGWSEPVYAGKNLVGITTGQSGSEMQVTPIDLIRPWIEYVGSHGQVPSWPGRFGANVQEIKDPALAGWLGLDEPRGILISRMAQGGSACGVLRKGDVLLSLDGLPIDGSGNARDPLYGLIRYDALLSRHHAGETIPVQVLRDRKVVDLDFPLRSYTAASWLIPVDIVDPPPYLMTGGLVFREYDDTYRGRSSELTILSQLGRTSQSTHQRRVVALSHVLSDTYNLGYHGFGDLPLAQVNGQPIDSIDDVVKALEHPQDGFDVFTFVPNSRIDEIVLDAATLPEATARIASTYGIAAPLRLSPPPPDLGASCDASGPTVPGPLRLGP